MGKIVEKYENLESTPNDGKNLKSTFNDSIVKVTLKNKPNSFWIGKLKKIERFWVIYALDQNLDLYPEARISALDEGDFKIVQIEIITREEAERIITAKSNP